MKKMSVAPSGKYKHAPHVAWRRVEDESVLLNVDTSDYYSLDPVATEIWERIGKGQRAGKIAVSVAESYGMPKSKVSKDTQSFISSLLKEKLLLPPKSA